MHEPGLFSLYNNTGIFVGNFFLVHFFTRKERGRNDFEASLYKPAQARLYMLLSHTHYGGDFKKTGCGQALCVEAMLGGDAINVGDEGLCVSFSYSLYIPLTAPFLVPFHNLSPISLLLL